MPSSTAKPPGPLIKDVRFVRKDTLLSVSLDDGRVLMVPVAWYRRLLEGSSRERRKWRRIGQGNGIHWPDLDEDISLEGLLNGRRSVESKPSLAAWRAGRSPRRAVRRNTAV